MAGAVLGDSALHDAVLESQREIDRALARQAQLLAEWDARDDWAADGSRSSACRFARETGVSESHARQLIHRGRRLRTMPATASAWLSGTLSCSRVDLLVHANHKPVDVLFARDEKVLVESISALSFSDARRCVRYWIQLADESGANSRGARLLSQRSASVSKTFEGSVDLRGLFDPVNGEIVLNEAKRLETQLFESDWAEAKERLQTDNILVSDLKRTPAQRRCDALVLMAERSAAKPADSVAPKPLISVVVDFTTFGRICELAGGEVIAPGQVVPLLGEADIERIVFDNKSRVVNVGRRRLFRGALRRAIEIRDRHCTHESGCDVRAKDCEVDHATAFSRGGNTDQTNGRLLCSWHNRWKGAGPP